jgi:SAM-dependent methyltransferase
MSEVYYRQHSRAYYLRTVNLDATDILEPVAGQVPPPARVFDLGCGSGRDLAWLKAQGYKAYGIEASSELAQLARRHSGCPILVADFTTYPLDRLQADLIIAVGSLVHLPYQAFSACLENIISGLRREQDAGFLYLSLKSGEGSESSDDGRVFYLWQDDDLRQVLAGHDVRIVQATAQPSKLVGEAETTWLGYLLKRV